MPKPASSIVGPLIFAVMTIVAIVLAIVGISIPWGTTGDLSRP